ncbi:hypothetical protein Ahy_A06g028713 [Arachis hypogaea]|uniref:Protein FAR1-RELATED SEQUENCE n=1 Tax=Arachis hypogaea TaxID=3818 RepID=A0A445CRJ0_ARAHY|nr:hypothetical protein Ahy_A06g028713 [Arachis hypogaea]
MKYHLGNNMWLSAEVYIAYFSVYASSDLAFQRSSFMNFNLFRSPLLGQDEKHTKKRAHTYYFNKFITWNSSLIQFVKQYDNCLGSREQRERESNATDFYNVRPCAIKFSIEAQFQHVYTHEKFRERKGELYHKIKALCSKLYGIRSYRTSFQLNIQQVCGYVRHSRSQSEMLVLIIRVKSDIVSSRSKCVQL